MSPAFCSPVPPAGRGRSQFVWRSGPDVAVSCVSCSLRASLLSLSSAVLGIYLAQFLSRYLVDLLSTGPLQVTFDLSTTWQILTFTLALAAVTTLLFGLAPAWQATARRPVDALKAVSANAFRGRLLPTVVTAQVALCLVLLVGAGLFISNASEPAHARHRIRARGCAAHRLDRTTSAQLLQGGTRYRQSPPRRCLRERVYEHTSEWRRVEREGDDRRPGSVARTEFSCRVASGTLTRFRPPSCAEGISQRPTKDHSRASRL